jgi:penicillin-binding protein 1A
MTRRERQRRRQRRHGRPLRRGLTVLGVLLTIGLVAGGIASGVWVADVVQSAPNIDQLHPQPQGTVSTVYAADGTRLGFIAFDTLRQPIGDRRIPLNMKRATVAIEDRRFYHHGGVDYAGLMRAAIRDVTSNGVTQGGSTLTMQLVRNLYTPASRSQKTLTRKIREMKLADQLEQEHSKEWILVAYLNNVPYGTVGGQTAVGVEAAARTFFGKPAAQLTLPQAALLAGMPQAPSQYNPFDNPAAARKRRGEVLRAMVQAGYITQAQADAANAAPLGVRHSDFYGQRREQFFFDYVKQQLLQHYGHRVVDRGGLKVYTTINLHFQQLARQAITDHLHEPGQPAAALVTVDPANGHILAMASSATYGPTVFNYATQAHRQPGSSFKVIDLMAAARMGIDPATTYYDSHELLPGWLPQAPSWHVQTDSHKYMGKVSLANALPPSDNTVYAQLGADVGPDKIDQAAHDMGVTSPLNAYYAEAIGGLKYGVSPLDMADAYATVSDGGWRNTAEAIARVVHPDGRVDDLGKPIRKKEFTDGETAKVIAPMKQVLISGTAAGLGIGCPAAGKTGTTSSFTDVWFVGITPRLSTAVWVGYPNETRSLIGVPGYGGEIFGATIPAPIWSEFMSAAKGSFCGDWPLPNEPFQAAPFFGSYTAGSKGDTGTGTTTTTPGTTTTTTTTTTNGPGGPGPGPNAANGKGKDKGSNPGAFAHPPQKAPKIPPPPKQPPNAGGGAGPPKG